jgi:hypothetical protein
MGDKHPISCGECDWFEVHDCYEVCGLADHGFRQFSDDDTYHSPPTWRPMRNRIKFVEDSDDR